MNGFKGEHAAWLSWVAAVILIPLFGVGMLVFVPFGLFFYLFHRSRDFVCGECRATSCPDCTGEITQNNYCSSCKVAHCPYCGHSQPVYSGVS